MELTEKRIAANRRNAKKSTGPKTDHGRKMSSRNSTKHSILANTILLDDEDKPRFAALVNTLIDDLQPQDDTQRSLVEKMAVAHWRLKRTWAMEAASIIHETRRQADSTLSETPPTRTMLAIRALAERDRHPDLWGQRELHYDREYHRALTDLTRLQQNKKSQRTHLSPLVSTSTPAAEPPSNPLKTPSNPQIPDVEPIPHPIEPTA